MITTPISLYLYLLVSAKHASEPNFTCFHVRQAPFERVLTAVRYKIRLTDEKIHIIYGYICHFKPYSAAFPL